MDANKTIRACTENMKKIDFVENLSKCEHYSFRKKIRRKDFSFPHLSRANRKMLKYGINSWLVCA